MVLAIWSFAVCVVYGLAAVVAPPLALAGVPVVVVLLFVPGVYRRTNGRQRT